MSKQSRKQTNDESSAMFAVRIDAFEVRFLLALRWDDGGPIPDWAEGSDGDLTIGFKAGPDSRVAVHLNMLVRDDDRCCAVRTEQVVKYEVALWSEDGDRPQAGNVEDTEKFLHMLGPEGIRTVANQALQDGMPYVREAIQSTSLRLLPENPIRLPTALPELPPGTEINISKPG